MEGRERDPSPRADARISEGRPSRRSPAILSEASEASKNDLIARELGCGGTVDSRSCDSNRADFIQTEREIREAIRLHQVQDCRTGSAFSSQYGSLRDQIDDPYGTIFRLRENLMGIFNNQPIMMSIDDGVKIVMGEPDGQPAYLITVTALAAALTPLCNYRYTTNIQRQILEELGIPPGRGMVKLQPMAEDNLGIDGITYGQKIRAMEEASNGENYSKIISRKTSTSHRRSIMSASSGFLRRFKSKSTLDSRAPRSSSKGEHTGSVEGMGSDHETKSK
ncbi:conserved hypothetical protein [Microsporum canis CBS 113480]|uniref:MIF domain-containing protein n=1 Tax=Arthroderma otae (strain ATCC MYA-4605 / CBS 113480) TaxID=554155 RepID=C5FBD8_ARTOC|nr:conserved hypothetical protein [Microsporum canis CBS 113480]EEQ27122.1 conserved hypothetical protein [Microsporum canis CBS 113480]